MARRLVRARYGRATPLLLSIFKHGLKERVKAYATYVVGRLNLPNAYAIAHAVDELLGRLDWRRVQGRNPRVVAGVLVEMACGVVGTYVDRGDVARVLGISKYTLRDNIRILKRAGFSGDP